MCQETSAAIQALDDRVDALAASVAYGGSVLTPRSGAISYALRMDRATPDMQADDEVRLMRLALDGIGAALAEQGLTLEELIESSREERAMILRERGSSQGAE
jgi:hypothetical protein